MERICLNCSKWQGDKAKMRQAIDESGRIVIDLDNGWAEYGECADAVRWMGVEVVGNAIAFVAVSAGFGCRLFEADADTELIREAERELDEAIRKFMSDD